MSFAAGLVLGHALTLSTTRVPHVFEDNDDEEWSFPSIGNHAADARKEFQAIYGLTPGDTFTLVGKKNRGTTYELLQYQIHGIQFGMRLPNGKIESSRYLSYRDALNRVSK